MMKSGPRLILFFLSLLLSCSTALGYTSQVNISSCQTLSGADTLYQVNTSLLADGSEACIVINAGTLELDFQGHSITGNGTNSGISVLTGNDDIRIVGFILNNFSEGITVGTNSLVTIFNGTIANCTANGIRVVELSSANFTFLSLINVGVGLNLSSFAYGIIDDLTITDASTIGVFENVGGYNSYSSWSISGVETGYKRAAQGMYSTSFTNARVENFTANAFWFEGGGEGSSFESSTLNTLTLLGSNSASGDAIYFGDFSSSFTTGAVFSNIQISNHYGGIYVSSEFPGARFYNLTFTNMSGYAIDAIGDHSALENIAVYNSSFSAYGAIALDGYNATLLNGLIDASVSGNHIFSGDAKANNTVRLINVTYNLSREAFTGTELARMWYVGVNVTGYYGAIEAANVTFSDASQFVLFSNMTDVNGYATGLFSYYFIRNGARGDNSPHTLSVRYAGFSNISQYNLTELGNFYPTVNLIPVAPSGGQGGGTTVIIDVLAQLAKDFNVTTFSYGNKLDIVLAKDSVRPRSKSFILVNRGKDQFQIKLACEATDATGNATLTNTSGSICDYVVFDKQTVTVSPNEVDPTTITVFVSTPPNASFGDQYSFNILALRSTGTVKWTP